jgi:hypothetical protein
MYISTSVPVGKSAIDELTKLFAQHFTERHKPNPATDDR